MFNIHDIDIKSNQTINKKRYINWMKHAILHVIIIRESSSKREYVTIQTRLYDENNEKIFVCIDIDFNVNFIDESLLSKNNFWNRLHNCHSIIVRNIANKRIVDKQMNIFLYITTIDESMKRLKIKTYVNKNIQTNVFLDMNEFDKIENDITIWLNRKKMQLNNCHVTINFTFRNNQLMIFFVESISRNHYTDFKSCFKSFDDRNSKKSIRFAKRINHLSYKSICIFDVHSKINANRFKSTIKTFNMSKNFVNLLAKRIYIFESSFQIKSYKNEIFETMHDSNFANLNIFANDFANVFIFHFFINNFVE